VLSDGLSRRDIEGYSTLLPWMSTLRSHEKCGSKLKGTGEGFDQIFGEIVPQWVLLCFQVHFNEKDDVCMIFPAFLSSFFLSRFAACYLHESGNNTSGHRQSLICPVFVLRINLRLHLLWLG